MMGYGYGDGDWGAGGWLVMIVMMVVFWGLLIGVVVWALRGARSGSGGTTFESGRLTQADQTLAERFARGDIAEDEFRRARELLHSTGHHREP